MSGHPHPHPHSDRDRDHAARAGFAVVPQQAYEVLRAVWEASA